MINHGGTLQKTYSFWITIKGPMVKVLAPAICIFAVLNFDDKLLKRITLLPQYVMACDKSSETAATAA